MKTKLWILLLAAATVITACNKDDNNTGLGGSPSVCPKPMNPTIDSITTSSALFFWDSISGASSYTVRYRSASDSIWITQVSTANSLLITSLNPNTAYECQVNTNCSTVPGSNSSDYSSSVIFITLQAVVSNTQNLCNKNWKLVSFKLNGIDVTSQFFQPCNLDDYTRFLIDSTYTSDEGPTKCDPADPQTSTGTWGWAANETKLIIDGDTSNVLTNSGSNLKLGINDATLGAIELTFGL